jgi:hypothetical protein
MLSHLADQRKTQRRRNRLHLELLEDRTLPTTFFVWQFIGSDTAGNGTMVAPFQSIQKAVNLATDGDTIRVAGGLYTHNAAADEFSNLGTTGVVVVFNKNLTILGGFNPGGPSGWNSPDATTPSVIDGQGQFRGILETNTSPTGTSLTMDSFTVQNGLGGQPPTPVGQTQPFGEGGGMLVQVSSLNLTNMVFQNNTAVGMGSPAGQGGFGTGGGIAAFSPTGTVQLQNITFTNNTCVGGGGTTSGNFGQGGGLFVASGNVNGVNLTFMGNRAQGGSSSGNGLNKGDALGGGADFEQCQSVTLSHVSATNNLARGGDAPAGAAGSGFGGAIENELGNVTVMDSTLNTNKALGGDGVTTVSGLGSIGSGGAVDVTNGNMVMDRVFVINNAAQGGNGGAFKGGPSGGGIHAVTSQSATPFTLTVQNSVVANNLATYGPGGTENGGGGGGISLNGTNANVIQSTLAQNALAGGINLQGVAILVNVTTLPGTTIPSTLNLSYSIVAQNDSNFSPPAAAVDVFPGTTGNFNINLFSANTKDTNADGSPNSGGTFSGLGTTTFAADPGFVAPGAPNFNYQITATSPAVDKAVGSPVTVDITGQPRDSNPDLGAFEFRTFVPPPPTTTGDSIGVFDPGTGTWYLRLQNGPGAPDIAPFGYGAPGWKGLIGDWDGNGTSTVGVFDPATATFYLRNENTAGTPDAGQFQYGLPNWIPLAGDWNGTGKTGIGAFDPTTATFYLRSQSNAGFPDVGVFQYGAPGWIPIVGDWNGDGKASIGVFDPATATFYLRNENTAGTPDAGQFQYGAPGWVPVTGDWNKSGKTEVAVVNPATEIWYIRFAAAAGFPDITPFPYGAPGWQPVAGHYIGLNHQFADPSSVGAGNADPLTQSQLNFIVTAALDRLLLAGVDSQTVARLGSLDYQVGNLPGGILGLTAGQRITIDPTAAGHGWFVDPTPLSDEEFAAGAPLVASADSPAAGKMDLLTVVLHEMGHAVGRDDISTDPGSGDLMAALLPAGVRRTQALDAVFAQASANGV